MLTLSLEFNNKLNQNNVEAGDASFENRLVFATKNRLKTSGILMRDLKSHFEKRAMKNCVSKEALYYIKFLSVNFL